MSSPSGGTACRTFAGQPPTELAARAPIVRIRVGLRWAHISVPTCARPSNDGTAHRDLLQRGAITNTFEMQIIGHIFEYQTETIVVSHNDSIG